jgi:sugar lactone lactonase YvrE
MQPLVKLSMQLGECPRWNSQDQAWYWVDILGNTLYRFHCNTDKLEQRVFDFQPACFAFTEANSILLSSSSGVYLLEDFNGELELLCNPETHIPGNRFNDGTSTPDGDFIVGSIGDGQSPTGISYRFYWENNTLQYQEIESGYTIINGQGFSPDGQYYYVTDTPEQIIYRQRYNATEKTLSAKEVFYRCNQDEYPDGAAIDSEGNYWVAMYGAAKIAVISPNGEKIKDIALPVSQPTMIAFGGDDLSQALITTAAQGLSNDDLKQEPLAGSVLIFDGAAEGCLPIRVKTQK